ncbi:hypothetical protein GLGCALEP_03488 [Pseudomonas sp. MM221]|nr:hypothetical protein DBADOPDK_03414 [Pseudomonas sp. MM223]CAI3804438.1 hypothetical protein GLGCALEP_03488 [Pseudomonas sp. MM221]
MSGYKNWFENNQTKSVIVYTLLVAAASLGASRFILDENRINLCEAETKSAVTVSEVHKAKVSALEGDIASLKLINERYLSWLEKDPKAFPALETKIKQLEKERDEANLRAASAEAESKGKVPQMDLYNFSKRFSKGESVEDPRTGVVIGISDVDENYKANGIITFPSGKRISLKEVEAGENWRFSDGGKDYKLKLDSINWINNSVKATVTEIPSGPREQ